MTTLTIYFGFTHPAPRAAIRMIVDVDDAGPTEGVDIPVLANPAGGWMGTFELAGASAAGVRFIATWSDGPATGQASVVANSNWPVPHIVSQTSTACKPIGWLSDVCAA